MPVDLSHACVICASTNDLNTQTVIKVSEEEQYTVAVCRACEDEAAPKQIRSSLTALLERISKLCKEAGSYLGVEFTLRSLCPRPAALAPAPAAVATQDPAQSVSEPVRQPGSVAIHNKPIRRDRRDGGGAATTTATRQKIAEQARDVTGKPLNLPQGVAIFENPNPVASDIHRTLEEGDGYRQCPRCHGDGGVVHNGQTVLCTICNGSGLV